MNKKFIPGESYIPVCLKPVQIINPRKYLFCSIILGKHIIC